MESTNHSSPRPTSLVSIWDDFLTQRPKRDAKQGNLSKKLNILSSGELGNTSVSTRRESLDNSLSY